MAKGNPFLDQIRGSIGNMVATSGVTRSGGTQQVIRSRNRSPKNPRSVLQGAQRSVMKTASLAYSILRPICDHSFQGEQREGVPCQSRFMELNVSMLRSKVAAFADGDAAALASSTVGNYAQRGSSRPLINEYIVSEGSLPELPAFKLSYVDIKIQGVEVEEGAAPAAAITYQAICDTLGLQAGDQLTVVSVLCDTLGLDATTDLHTFTYMSRVRLHRIILAPADGDMSKAFLVNSGQAGYVINDPNPRNEGDILSFDISTSGNTPVLTINIAQPQVDIDKPTIAASNVLTAFIASRYDNGRWYRSPARLRMQYEEGRVWALENVFPLSEGIASYTQTSESRSTLYLNQSV